MTTSEQRLVCPNHGVLDNPEHRIYLYPIREGDVLDRDGELEEATEDDDDFVVCPVCHSVWQNFIKHPWAQIANRKTGEVFMKNVLTGEVDESTRRKLGE